MWGHGDRSSHLNRSNRMFMKVWRACLRLCLPSRHFQSSFSVYHKHLVILIYGIHTEWTIDCCEKNEVDVNTWFVFQFHFYLLSHRENLFLRVKKREISMCWVIVLWVKRQSSSGLREKESLALSPLDLFLKWSRGIIWNPTIMPHVGWPLGGANPYWSFCIHLGVAQAINSCSSPTSNGWLIHLS